MIDIIISNFIILRSGDRCYEAFEDRKGLWDNDGLARGCREGDCEDMDYTGVEIRFDD